MGPVVASFEADRWTLDATLIEPHAYADDVVDGRIVSDQTAVFVLARDGSIWRRSLIDHSDRFVRSAVAPGATLADARFVDDDTLVSIEGDGARWSLWRVELATGRRTLCRQSRGRSGATIWHSTFGPFVEATQDRRATLARLDGEAWVVLARGLAREVPSDAVRILDRDTVLRDDRAEDFFERSLVVASVEGDELRRIRPSDPRLEGTDRDRSPIVLDADHLLWLRERPDEATAVEGVVYRWRDDTCIDLHAFLQGRGGAVVHGPAVMGYESERSARWLPPTAAATITAHARSRTIIVFDHSKRWVVMPLPELQGNDIAAIDLATGEQATRELRGRALRAWPNGDGSKVLTTHVDGVCCLWDARERSLLDERVVHGRDLRWTLGDTGVIATTSDEPNPPWIRLFSCARSRLELVSERPLAPNDRRVFACHPDARWALIDRTARDMRGAKRWLVALASVGPEATSGRAWRSKVGCFDGDSVLLAAERAVIRCSIDEGASADAELFALSGPTSPFALNRFGAVTRRSESGGGPCELIVDRADEGRFVWRSDVPMRAVEIASDAPVIAAHLDDHAPRQRIELRSFHGASLGSVSISSDGDSVESMALSGDGRAIVVVTRRGGVYVLRCEDGATDASRPPAPRG